MLTRYLRQAGYKTATFSSFGDRHHAWWYFAGWNEVHAHSLKEGNEDAHEVNAAVIPWLKAHGKEDNYFLHIQYWDPHTMYTYPKSNADQWKDQPIGEFPDEATIQRHRESDAPRSATFLHWTDQIPETMPKQIRSREDLKHLVDGYDGAIHYMDRFIGEILDTLREMGIEDEVCFVISADHGESMGEQGIYMEHASATEAVHHIPLIIRAPGITKPGAVYEPFVYNVDVVASIADLVGLEVPSGWDGQSFLPLMSDGKWENRDYLVMDHALYVCQRAVRDKKWYFIRTYHEGLYHFDDVTLYDMENDPHQLDNVADQYPDIVRLMDHRLNEWMQEQIRKPNYQGDPMQKVIQTGPFKYLTVPGWADRLRRDGYPEAAARLEAKYAHANG